MNIKEGLDALLPRFSAYGNYIGRSGNVGELKHKDHYSILIIEELINSVYWIMIVYVNIQIGEFVGGDKKFKK